MGSNPTPPAQAGDSRNGVARFGVVRQARHGAFWSGKFRAGMAREGGKAGCVVGMVWQASHG